MKEDLKIKDVEVAKRQLAKTTNYTQTIKRWDDLTKGYKCPEGQKLVEIRFKDGKPQYITEEDEEVTKPLLKKS